MGRCQSIKFNRVWNKLISILMDDFVTFKISVEEITAGGKRTGIRSRV